VNLRSLSRRPALLLAAGSTVLSAAFAIVSSAGAVTTERFVLDDAESLAEGELIRTAVHSDGRVESGAQLKRIALPDDVPLVYSTARSGDDVYLGTGNNGRIYRLRGDNVELFAETQQLLVGALAVDGATVYAGTLPEGRIYRIGADGQAAELVDLDADHVWGLVWDARRNLLFAATGPEGRVIAIDRNGRPTVWWDSDASHVMSLALAADGALYAGTSDDAVVVRITAQDRVETVQDFPGNEITALAVRGDELAVAANEFPPPPSITSTASAERSPSAGRAPRQAPGKGRIWRVNRDGRSERVYERLTAHVTSLAILDDGTIVGGLGNDGHVVRVNPDRTHTTWIDVEERQVLALNMEGGAPIFATGDGAAVYRIVDARPTDAIWESKVLDARFRARWGQLVWRAEGTLVFQTRSGNTEEPDDTWSDWSADTTTAGPIRSPEARFLQIRARFDRDQDAVLRAVTAYFLPQNQRPRVSEVRVEGANEAATKRMRAERQGFVPDASAMYKLAWSIENTDDDRVRYRLSYRREDQTVWRDMLRSDHVLTDDEYTWNTASIPDGFYVVRVEASDELDNPETLTLRHSADSEPIRIDNHAPRIEDLRTAGARVTGRAVDALGPIARLERAVDGGEWVAIFPVDDLFDTAEERFEIDLSSLPAGPHIVSVRATDASGNVVSAETQLRR
jgi:outer membrane protein assembly factor BamB